MEIKRTFLVYIGLSIAYILSTLANLAVQDWYDYCYWTFGLIHGKSFTKIKDFENEKTIMSVRGDACGSLQNFIEIECSDACDQIKKIETAGIVYIIFTMCSIISSIICTFFHYRVYIDHKIELRSIGLFMIAPFVFNLIGLSVYLGVGDFVNLRYGKGKYENHTRRFTPKIGFCYALGNMAFCIGVMLYGFMRSKKIMLKKNQ